MDIYLRFDICNLFGTWKLGFGIFNFKETKKASQNLRGFLMERFI
jgi:hypothetical protein